MSNGFTTWKRVGKEDLASGARNGVATDASASRARRARAETASGTGALVAAKVVGLALLSLLVASTSFFLVFAITEASITTNATGLTPTQTPGNQTSARGTITTMVLNAVQQDQHWKGYVGNVTGLMTLDDADGFTIYSWNLLGVTIEGEVYAVRSSNTDFSTITCADSSDILTEQTYHNMTSSDADSLNSTFNYTIHDGFWAATSQILQDDCPSTATYVNDTRQPMTSAAGTYFQELLLMDANNNMLFTTIIEENLQGYTNSSVADNTTFDFQMILPESHIKSTPTTYYFYTELGS